MLHEVTHRRAAVLIGFVLLVIFSWWPELIGWAKDQTVCDPKLLCVVFLDIGQGDSIFIQSPSGEQLLIDGGPDNKVLSELSTVMDLTDRDLDYVLATHPDADHVSGLIPVLERFTVHNIIRTENESDTATWQKLVKTIDAEGAEVHMARRGQRYDLGKGVELDILFPDTDPSAMESNTSSIVARLVYGGTSFMLTGDSPKSIEEYLVLLDGEYLKSDVLKAGHHGSRTSTSELFLSHIDPTYAVISAGKNNRYGHPHVEVTDLLFNYGVKTINTADHGRVVFWSNGKNVTLK